MVRTQPPVGSIGQPADQAFCADGGTPRAFRALMVRRRTSNLESVSVVSLESVTVRLGGRPVLDDANLTVGRGEVVGVTGPNGAGKTTLLRVAANLLRPARGRRVGHPTLAYVPAAIEPPLLRAGAWLAGVRRQRRVPPVSLLEHLAFDGDLDRPCRELSFGNLRKVLLADAFSSCADLIIIDEATEGLDSHGASAQVELMVAARTRGAGVLIAEQQTQRIVGADRLVSLRRGRLVVESVSDTDEVTISMCGPASQLGELTDAAAALGFRYLVERE
jgi:ABC-type multidrug transport system ATPase subunit